ncbi:MAG: hypothetical protein N3I35_17330 [Clostridia bacterium]|nr:hypothetical protein [Clostridia bacterium]
MKFLKGFLVLFLITIIIGGLGYIGYSFLYTDHSAMDMSGTQNTTAVESTDKTNPASSAHQNMQGIQQDSSKHNQNSSGDQQSLNNHVGLNQANVILLNKEKLNKSTAVLKEALELMTVDPYAPDKGNSEDTSDMQAGNSKKDNAAPSGAVSPNTTMKNMGTAYDPNKMEKLHSGLYKISVGMALLEQLNNELTYQAENASSGIQNLVQYYSNQYNQTVQNKNKLNQAYIYVSEAANLVNINPYVSTDGLVYDKNRMNQIHQSVFKLAEGVAALNLLSDDFTKQTIILSNTVQTYINNTSSNTDTAQMNHTAISAGLFGGLFENVSPASVINVILIIFVTALIIGILGFISNLLKTPVQKKVKKEDAAKHRVECKFCGKEMNAEWKCCPDCGTEKVAEA